MKRVDWHHICGFLFVAILSPLSFLSTLEAAVVLNSSLSVTETYTDNLFFESKHQKRDDWGTFLSPRITLAYQSKDVVVEGTYIGLAQLYVNHTQANAYSHNANFSIDLPFLTKNYKGFEVQFIESFNFSPALQGFALDGDAGTEDSSARFQDGQTPLGAGGNVGVGGIGGLGNRSIGNQGVFTGRGGRNSFQNVAGVNVRYSLTPRWTPNVSYRNIYTTFAESDLNDSLTHQLGAGTTYQHSARTSFNANYILSITSIEDGDTIYNHSVLVGGSHLLTPSVNVNANAGFTFTESSERVTFTTNSSITKSFDRGSVTLRYGQIVSPGGGLSLTAATTQTAVANANYTFTKRLSGFLAAGWSKNKSISGNSVDITSYQGQGGLNFSLLSWLSGNLSYSYIKQKSRGTAIGARTAEVNQVFVGVTATAPQWKITN